MSDASLFGPIPQYEDQPQSWSRFLTQAARGSDEAVTLLFQADHALAVELGGEPLVSEQPIAEYERVMAGALPAAPPFVDPRTVLEQAAAVGLIDPASLVWPGRPFRAWDDYTALGSRGVEVPPVELLADAAHQCVGQWSPDAFRATVNNVEASGPAYNSLDVTAAMLWLASCWSTLRQVRGAQQRP